MATNKRRHSNYTKTFEECDWRQQSSSITMQGNKIVDATRAHVRRAIEERRDPRRELQMRENQMLRLAQRVARLRREFGLNP